MSVAWQIPYALSLLACGTTTLDAPDPAAEAPPVAAPPAEAATLGDGASSGPAFNLDALPCGESRKITTAFRNTGTAAFNWQIVSTEPHELITSVGAIGGHLAAGAEVPLSVVVRAPVDQVRPGVALAGVVRIETRSGLGAPKYYEAGVRFVPAGAWVEVPSSVDLGAVPVATPGATPFGLKVTNRGTQAVSVALARGAADPDPFAVATPPPLVLVAAGSTVDLPMLFRPRAARDYTATLNLDVQGTLCNSVPREVVVKASGSGSPFRVDGTLDMGTHACGEQARGQMTFAYYGERYKPWRAILSPSSRYRIVERQGLIYADQTLVLEVEEKAPADVPGAYDEILTLDFDGETFDVKITSQVEGAVLRYAEPTGHSFAKQKLNGSTVESIAIFNDGNAATTVSSLTTTDSAFAGTSTLPITIPAGASRDVLVTFAPKEHISAHVAELNVFAPQCGRALRPLRLTGDAFARAKSFWAVGSAWQDAPYQDATCMVLDDDQLLCNGRVVGTTPAGRTLGRSGLLRRACTYGPGLTVQCLSQGLVLPFVDEPALDGVVEALEGRKVTGLLSNGQVLSSIVPRTVAATPTGVAQSVPDFRYGCLRLMTGRIACFGNSDVGSAIDRTAQPDDLLTIPGVADAIDFGVIASSTLPRLLVLRATGEVVAYRTGPGLGPAEPVAGVTDGLRIAGENPPFGHTLCVLRQSGTVTCLKEGASVVASLVELSLTGVIDLVGVRGDGLLWALLSDGRVVRGKEYGPWAAEPGFE